MSGEKTEEPTEHKLKKAREQGQVAQSQDLTMAVSMLGVVAVLLLTADQSLDHFRSLLHSALDFADDDLTLDLLSKRMGAMVIDALWIFGPSLLAAALFGLIGMVSHVGVGLSFDPVKPQPDRVNPVAGFKRLFSLQSVFDLLQNVIKAAVLAFCMWKLIEHLVPLIAGSAYQSTHAIGAIAWSAVTKLLGAALLLFVVLGPADYALKRWIFMRGQRMSFDDIRREFKEMEGDPFIHGQRMALAIELAHSDPRKSVAGANAVLVNPTHYAVAVRYRPQDCGLPVIVAKGVDEEALRIRRYAEEAGVPVFSNPPLARALHKVGLNDTVPEELFETVAAVLRWVDEIGPREHQRPMH